MNKPLPRRECDVLILGGGMTGATLALALAETDLTVALVDRADPLHDARQGRSIGSAPWWPDRSGCCKPSALGRGWSGAG